MTAVASRANYGFIATIVAVATLGGFMFGYHSGAINGTQNGLQHAFHLDAQLGFTVSALLPGCAIGAFLAGRLADSLGRRNVMMLAAVLFMLSATCSGAASSACVSKPSTSPIRPISRPSRIPFCGPAKSSQRKPCCIFES